MSYLKAGKLDVQGDVYGDCWQKVYENTLTSAATSVTISGLDGNTDIEYELVVRGISAIDTYALKLEINNDTTDANYGYQLIQGSNATAAAGRNTGYANHILLGSNALNSMSLSHLKLYAKSGYVRTGILTTANNISGTTVTEIKLWGVVWNNTTDNITSLVLSNESATENLAIGSYICLWAKKWKR